MPFSAKALWASRLNHVYGDMRGQRAVSLTDITSKSAVKEHGAFPDQTDLIIALETYYALVCLLVASSSLKKSPSRFLEQFLSARGHEFRKSLTDLLDGRYFEQSGINGFRNAFDFNWLPEYLTNEAIDVVIGSLSPLQNFWDGKRLLINGLDPLQQFHKVLFPKNLMHITGQFYSPEWLAELLIDDVGYQGRGRFVDPFCGSGVFLLAAVEKSVRLGIPPREALDNVLGIDLNPSACIAARCNFVIYLSQLQDTLREPISLNIINADSIAPAIIKGRLRQKGLFDDVNQLSVDGETIPLTDDVLSNLGKYTDALRGYGLQLDKWSEDFMSLHTGAVNMNSRERRIMEQLFLFNMKPAEFLLTNPPWVGWEYMSRPYRTEIQPAWDAYDLFGAKGLEAAFLKEDLSTLAMVTAWDLYLATSGKSAAVLKPSTMRADLTGRGIRRLSLRNDRAPVCLKLVREFERIKVFSDAQTETCAWIIQKDRPTEFPVPVTVWTQIKKRWSPGSSDPLESVRENVKESTLLLERTDPRDFGSRWLIAKRKQIGNFAAIKGSNSYSPRMGVFTGGANAVFYLEPVPGEPKSPTSRKWSNIVERAKRPAPKREFELENDIVKQVLRGRDIEMWRSTSQVSILFPHTPASKMYPLPANELAREYPLAWQYLQENADILKSRKGFAGWEKKIHERFLYTLQRIGEYTFSPFKVCWKYISSEFTICVLGANESERYLIPNDKVMFIPFNDLDEAFFVGGILSSSIVRSYVHSCMSSRQISTNIIKAIYIPEFQEGNHGHHVISRLCDDGHELARKGQFKELKVIRDALDEEVNALYSDKVALVAA